MEAKCERCVKRVPWVVFFGKSMLAVFQIAVGLSARSKGLVADGIHSASDIIASIMMMLSLTIASREDDENHPWGRGKAEYAASILIYSLLIVVAFYILFDAIQGILKGRVQPPRMVAFVAGLVAMLANFILSSYGACAGKKISSPFMVAFAKENRSDILTGVAVAIGIIGSNMGFIFLDGAAAVLVALIILKAWMGLWLEAFRNLIDESLPISKTKLIKQTILQYREVKDISFIKTRRVGQLVWVDVEILVDPTMSVSQGYAIAREIRLALIRRFKHIKDVNVTYTCKESPFSKIKNLIQKGKTFTQDKLVPGT